MQLDKIIYNSGLEQKYWQKLISPNEEVHDKGSKSPDK
jgi:hypothetical protein